MIRGIVFYILVFLAALVSAVIIAQLAYGQCLDSVMSDRLTVNDIEPYMATLGIELIIGVHNNPAENTATVYFKRTAGGSIMALVLVRFETGRWYDPNGGQYICRSYR